MPILPQGRGVKVEGDANNAVIVTGDGAQISINQKGKLSFRLLGAEYREAQKKRPPDAMYDGATPNWANIAKGQDAQRNLYKDVRAFVEEESDHPYRMALILGLAGEGKTTLLRRLAWDLAETGYPVLWGHSGSVFDTPNIDFGKEFNRPLILCFDQANQHEELPTLVDELKEAGVPYVLVGTARKHEWSSAKLEASIKVNVFLRKFVLARLDENEVNALLDKLEQANKLDKLKSMSRSEQMQHFLDKLKADGQLLPAMLTARTGENNFETYIESVLERIEKRTDGNFLLHAYAILALVHRFGFWLSRDVFAQAIGETREDIGHKILRPLAGELLEVMESEGGRLHTRHAIVAEWAIKILTKHDEPRVMEEIFLYQELYQALKRCIQNNSYEQKLLTMIPLIHMKHGEFDLASRLFEQGTKVDPSHAPLWQAWALMEQKFGRVEHARQLFEQGTKADPSHAPAWQAWGVMEKALGNYEEARRLFKEATQADSKHAPSWQAWALMEKETENYEKARCLFKEATKADPKHVPSWQAWGVMEKELGNYEEARRLFEEATRIDPKHAPAWQAWGVMEKELGNCEEARRLFDEATKADSKHAAAWQPWALMEKEIGNYEEARRLFKEATKADPNHAAAWQPWALMELELNNLSDALNFANQAVALQPQDFHPYIARGKVLLAIGQEIDGKSDLETSISILRNKLTTQKKNAKLLNIYGGVLIELKEYQLAEEILDHSLAFSTPHNKQFTYIMLGKLYAAQNMVHQAIMQIEKALQYSPNSIEAKKLLEELKNKQ